MSATRCMGWMLVLGPLGCGDKGERGADTGGEAPGGLRRPGGGMRTADRGLQYAPHMIFAVSPESGKSMISPVLPPLPLLSRPTR